jgi:hypothetical protein
VFPTLDIDTIVKSTSNTVSSNAKLGTTFLFDFVKGDFVLQNGKLVELKDIEALKMWIEKVLKTEKFKFKIYKKANENEDEYGISINDFIVGNKYPKTFMLSELEREITEALFKNPLILNLENFNIDKVGSTLNINFTVILKDSRTFKKEVTYG